MGSCQLCTRSRGDGSGGTDEVLASGFLQEEGSEWGGALDWVGGIWSCDLMVGGVEGGWMLDMGLYGESYWERLWEEYRGAILEIGIYLMVGGVV